MTQRSLWDIDLDEDEFEPKPEGEKQFYKLHRPDPIDNRDPKLGDGNSNIPFKATNPIHDRRKNRDGYPPDGSDEKAYFPPGPGQYDQGKRGLVSTSLPTVVTQEWKNPYQQPVSDPTPAGGWPMRRKLVEIQRTAVNLATNAQLRLELTKEEADGTVFRFASVGSTHPACNSPDLLIRNLQEHLKDSATIQELGRRIASMEPENKVWETYLRIKPKGERQ
jgi:hypothetical protein